MKVAIRTPLLQTAGPSSPHLGKLLHYIHVVPMIDG